MRQILLPSLLALFVALFGNILFPGVHLFAFAPVLALIFIKRNFLSSLWLASLLGLLLDLLTSQMRFGLLSLCFCLTAIVTYRARKLFFADKPLALALYTLLISAVYTSLELIVIYGNFPISSGLILTDIIGMSLLDAVYAFVCFTCPMKIYHYFKKRLHG